MKIDLFLKIFNNKLLFRKIFLQVNHIHVDILKVPVTSIYKWNQIKESKRLVALYGNLDDLKKLYINSSSSSDDDYILKLLQSYYGIPLTEIMISKQLETLKYFINDLKWYQFLVSRNNDAIDKFKKLYGLAASYGSVEIIEYLDQINRDISIDLSGSTTGAIDLASRHGNIHMIKWLHHHRTENGSTDAIDNAAMNGHLEIVKWLTLIRTEGCTTDAMDNAAMNGHLKTIKWLHYNRTEGCTTDAMDDYNGHFEIMKWLHYNRTEGCNLNAMSYAAEHGHLEIIKWLHYNRTEGCTSNAMNIPAENGHLEIINWLHHNRSQTD